MTSDERKRLLAIADEVYGLETQIEGEFGVSTDEGYGERPIAEEIRWLAGQGLCGIEERTGNRCKSQCPSCLTWVPRTVPASTEGYWPPDDPA